MGKKLLKAAGILLAAILLVVGGYAAYVFIAYHRLPDVDVTAEAYLADPGYTGDAGDTLIRPGEVYRVLTWNLGFGAYSADFGFFLDGGAESRAYSKQAVLENLGHAVDVINAQGADFKLLQEIDIGSTRSHHVDEAALIERDVEARYVAFGQNYDSPYLFYPITEPHGASKSGLLTLSDAFIARRQRVGLPVEKGFMKLLDLDRCYTVAHIPVQNGKTLCLYNLHLSAYTSDGAIATEQLKLLCADMLARYEAGNYVVAGGDFNKDLPGNSGEIFGVSGEGYTWAQPLETGVIPEGLTLVDSLGAGIPVPSCRNADGPYAPGESFVLTIDGFIVSDNVKVEDCRVIDEGFACSDHNPVVMEFELME